MIRSADIKELAIKSLIVLGLWVIIVLLISSTMIVFTIQTGSPVDVLSRISYELICISPWIICTPAIIWLARSYQFGKGTILKSLAVHVVAAAVVFSFHSLVQSNTVFYYNHSMTFSWSYIWLDFFGFLDMRVILYIGILLVIYAIDYQKKKREIKLRKSELTAELNEAKFQALLNQIQPDFLLSSIDTIREQLDHNLKEAEEVLTKFSDLLRIMLNNANREEVPVQYDIKSYKLYVDIMEKRLEQNIQIKMDVDEDCHRAFVPSFLLLIPLLEKMIRLQNKYSKPLTGICYIAKRRGDNIDLGVSIEGDIVVAKIADFFQDERFSEMVESLRNKYGEQLAFNTKYEKKLVYIGLTIPYLKAEKINDRPKYSPVFN